MTITLACIDSAENAVKRVRVELQAIGREIYKMREGHELGPEYGFDSYSRFNFSGPEYAGEDGPDWGKGTPVFALTYYWPRGENITTVTFPMGWLEQDWRALEKDRLDEEERAEAERKRIADAEAMQQREANEKAAYLRLKAKFEPAADQEPQT